MRPPPLDNPAHSGVQGHLRQGGSGPGELARARAELRARLEARREELEREALTRVNAIADSAEVSDPAYAQGLRATVAAAIDYALEAIERGEERAPSPPPALLAQARLAARSRVSLDTVLRRYLAGYTLLGDFLAHEAEAGRPPVPPARLQRDLAATLDRLLAAVGAEYEREAESRARSSEWRRAERVRRLLAGEPLDTSEIAYDFEGHHIGLVTDDRGDMGDIRELATALDARLLLVRREATAWAWLGARRPLDPAEVERAVSSSSERPPSALALGEPASGLAGWRLTHRQAAAALPVAQRGPDLVVRYGDVSLLASILRDDLLVASLRRLYLAPLEEQRDRGEVARETLRAYFAAGRNASSAAASLGVNRNTIAERLRAIEEAIGRPLSSCAPELETALRLVEPDAPVSR